MKPGTVGGNYHMCCGIWNHAGVPGVPQGPWGSQCTFLPPFDPTRAIVHRLILSFFLLLHSLRRPRCWSWRP